MIKPAKIELNLGNPKNGWLPLELKSADFTLEFNASNAPENPIDTLCESLILALHRIETEICWNLEPARYYFELKPSGKDIEIKILKSNGTTKNRNLIYTINGNFESVILPLYRSLKKFNTLELAEKDWKETNQIKLNTLTRLIKELKNG